MSYTNLQLYSAVLPSYDTAGKDKGGEGDVVYDGDDPEQVEQFFASM